jgi:FAD/FMN-containing dehydrogenase
MPDITIQTLSGVQRPLSEDRVSELQADLQGSVVTPFGHRYDQARSIWNAMIDRRPAIIAQCEDVDDVVAAVRFASEANALTSVKGGGHNIAGSAVVEGGLMIDLSRMNGVAVDLASASVRVGPGATLAELDAATAVHGLVVPTGINSTTGIAGLTLGGGFGWLTRAFGLTIDSLVSAEVVTADGRVLRASVDEHADLFWALRGGGGNFGIVTEFEFRAHVAGPDLLSGLIVLPFDRAGEALRLYQATVDTAPDELTVWSVMRKAPPLPFLPEAVHGTEVAILAICYAGDASEGARVLEPLTSIVDPIAVAVGVQPFTAWQQAFDPLLTAGARNYWKSHDIPRLEEAAIATILEHVARFPSDETEVFFGHVGGAATRVGASATAFPNREPHLVMNLHTRWRDPAGDASCIAWARSFFEAMRPYSTGVYVNFMPEDDAGRLSEAYGPNLAQLAEVKAIYDPGNFFRRNQNVAPAVPARRVG